MADEIKQLLEEVKLLRKEIELHSKIQQKGLKEWMNADVKSHYEKDKKVTQMLKILIDYIKKK